MTAPEISVIIPTYQRRDVVVRAIASALDQHRPPAEVIVVDDGSTDGTADAVVERFGTAVRLLRQPNRGPSAARNAGAAAARGDVLALLDSDDRWFPHHLDVIAGLVERQPRAVVVATEIRYRQGDDTVDSAQLVDLARPMLLGRTSVGHTPALAIRRDAFLRVGGFDVALRQGEDTELLLRLAIYGPVAMIAATTYERFRLPDSLVTEGRRTGGFLLSLRRGADNAMSLLDRSRRPDADELKRYCGARHAMAQALLALARSESPMVVRAHLVRARTLVPDLAGRYELVRFHGWAIPGWADPERRIELERAIQQAWPDPSWSAQGRLDASFLAE